MASMIPLVDYLVAGGHPHPVANECTACGVRFCDRRNAGASCGRTGFARVDVPFGFEPGGGWTPWRPTTCGSWAST